MPGNGSIGGGNSCHVKLHFNDKPSVKNEMENECEHIDEKVKGFTLTVEFPAGTLPLGESLLKTVKFDDGDANKMVKFRWS